jgi:hypothetical protein
MSVISGILGARATSNAADTAASAQANAAGVEQNIYNQQRADFEPYRQVGLGAIPDYQKMLTGGYDMKESPAAQYELTQGTKALNRQLAGRGMLGGGNAAQRLTELSQGIAAKDWNSQYSRLLDALKLGTGASASMGAASNTLSSNTQSGANSLANIYNTSGNTRAGLYSSMGLNSAAVGLKGYQVGQQAGMWGNQSTNQSGDWTDEWLQQ